MWASHVVARPRSGVKPPWRWATRKTSCTRSSRSEGPTPSRARNLATNVACARNSSFAPRCDGDGSDPPMLTVDVRSARFLHWKSKARPEEKPSPTADACATDVSVVAYVRGGRRTGTKPSTDTARANDSSNEILPSSRAVGPPHPKAGGLVNEK